MKTTVSKSGGIVAVMDTANGRRSIPLGVNTKREANAIIKAANLPAVEAMAKAGTLTHTLIKKLVIGRRLTVADAIEEWAAWLRPVCNSERTAGNHILYVNAWAREARVLTLTIDQIEEEHLSRWVNADDGNKMATKRVRLAALRSFFQFTSIRQYTDGDPSRLVRVKARLLTHDQKEPRQKQCFTDEEFRKLIVHLESEMKRLAEREKPTPAVTHKAEVARFWYCASLIGRYAGLRLGDICSLEWASLDKPGKLIVWTDKKDTRVELDVDDNLSLGISAIPMNNRKLCFPEQDAIQRGKDRAKLSVQFGRVLAGAGVSNHSFHDLRHTYASECARKGISMPHIAKRLGHGSEESTETYVHKDVED